MRGGHKRLPLSWSLLDPFPLTFSDPNLQKKYRVGLNRITAKEVPIEIKVVNPHSRNQLQKMEPRQMFWVRSRGYIGKKTPVTVGTHSAEAQACHPLALCNLGCVASVVGLSHLHDGVVGSALHQGALSPSA